MRGGEALLNESILNAVISISVIYILPILPAFALIHFLVNFLVGKWKRLVPFSPYLKAFLLLPVGVLMCIACFMFVAYYTDLHLPLAFLSVVLLGAPLMCTLIVSLLVYLLDVSVNP